MSDLARLRRFWPDVRPDLGGWLLALVAAPIATGIGLLQPLLLMRVVDGPIASGDVAGARWLAAVWLGTVLLGYAAESAYMVSLARAAFGTIHRVRDRLFRHVVRRPLAWHDREPSGRNLSRVTSDIEALGETLTLGAITLLLDAFVILGTLSLLLWLHAGLFAVLLLLAPPLVAIVELSRRRMRGLFLDLRALLADATATLAERIAGIEVVHGYRDEGRASAQFDGLIERYRQANHRNNLWEAMMFSAVDAASALALALVLAGAVALPEGITAGLLAAVIDLVGRLFTPIRELSGKVTALQRASAALEKIDAALEVPDGFARGGPAPDPAFRALVLDDLHFAYDGGDDVLSGVSLTVRRGEVLALVGRTGSGKSTVTRLVSAAYGGYRGHLRLDDVEASSADVDAWRRLVGVVHQDPQLYPGTVRDNLRMGADLPDERLRTALRGARADEVVARLGGLDGRVEAGGRNLSVGEGQLLSLARALAHDRPILVLDEATASVDPATEARIAAATEELMRDRTVVVVAHRLQTVRHADRIAVLHGGRVVEEGRHDELMARGGRYAEAWALAEA
jgi:ATP-binding cassette subfamily B protein